MKPKLEALAVLGAGTQEEARHRRRSNNGVENAIGDARGSEVNAITAEEEGEDALH
jgi:hypothetical protein